MKSRWTDDETMVSAMSKYGMTGETKRHMPPAYLDKHPFVGSDWQYPSSEMSRSLARLTRMGWLNRVERVIDHPGDNDPHSFLQCPPHRLILATYYATAQGIAAWYVEKRS